MQSTMARLTFPLHDILWYHGAMILVKKRDFGHPIILNQYFLSLRNLHIQIQYKIQTQ